MVNDLHFQYRLRVLYQDACLVQIWWFLDKSMTSYRADKPNFIEFKVKMAKMTYVLEGHGQWPPFSIPAKSIPRCMFGANLVILDQICDELLCGQGKGYGRTDRDRQTDGGGGRTDRQTQATTIPLQPERPRGENQNTIFIQENQFSNIACKKAATFASATVLIHLAHEF